MTKQTTGLDYESSVKRLILKPAGIKQMRLGGESLADRYKNEAVYYGQQEDPYHPVMRVRRMGAHGGWLASSIDLVRFATHVDGFSFPSDLLRKNSITQMTASSGVNQNYARGWSVNKSGNWWHIGTMNGCAAIIARTRNQYCWALLVNTRSRRKDFKSDLDALPWKIQRTVTQWPDEDLFTLF